MLESKPFAAELIEASTAGIATAATRRLLESAPEQQSRLGVANGASWQSYYVQRLLELGAALRIGAPEAFSARAVWQHKAFLARDLDAADVAASLESLKATVLEELPNEHAATIAGYIEQALAALGDTVTPDGIEIDPGDPAGAVALKFLAACLEGNPKQATAIVLQHAADAGSLESTYLDVLFPALREVGRMWHSAEATIAEEHIVSETTRRLMALLTAEYSQAADAGKTVVSAAVAGNAHDIGVRAVADFFEAAGWRSLSLGPNVPPADIANAVQYFDADLLVLAATLTTQIRSLEASIAAVRALGDRNVRILVGGQALDEAPELWQQLGADGYAAAGKAVEVGTAIVA
jgi:methanogenic corrinoid protein MtbC1